MKSQPPRRRTTTDDLEAAADAFVSAAGSRGGGDVLPWEAPGVREDVTKAYALRLREPLYLKLKWAAEQRGQSMNAFITEAVEGAVGEILSSAEVEGR